MAFSEEAYYKFIDFMVDEISKIIFKPGDTFDIPEKDEYLVAVLGLYAKQTKLIESIVVLLKNNMAEDAYVLFRSFLNNYLLIRYLCPSKTRRRNRRYKNYKEQPKKANLIFLRHQKIAADKGWTSFVPYDDLVSKIKEYETYLDSKGVDDKFFTVWQLAQADPISFQMYATYYNNASQYEHADVSTLKVYEEFLRENGTIKFKIDLSYTNENLKRTILGWIIKTYILCFGFLAAHIQNHHNYLFSQEKFEEMLEFGNLIINSKTFSEIEFEIERF